MGGHGLDDPALPAECVDVLRCGLLSLPVEPQVRRDLVADAHRSSPHVNGVLSDDRRSVEDPSLRLQSALVVPARQGESSPPAPPQITLRGNQSEERRVGPEGVRKGKCRGWPYHYNKKKKKKK